MFGFCFVPKDIEATKVKIKAFKEYTDGVKKSTFENGVQSTVPNAGKQSLSDEDALRKSMGLAPKKV